MIEMAEKYPHLADGHTHAENFFRMLWQGYGDGVISAFEHYRSITRYWYTAQHLDNDYFLRQLREDISDYVVLDSICDDHLTREEKLKYNEELKNDPRFRNRYFDSDK